MKTSRHRSPTRVAAVVAISALALVACESRPSASRVAEDIIKTLATTDAERDCMLDIVENDYPGDTLDEIGEGVENGDPQAEADLAEFESKLESCR